MVSIQILTMEKGFPLSFVVRLMAKNSPIAVSLLLLIVGLLSLSLMVKLSAETGSAFYHEIRPLFKNGAHFGNVYRFRNVGLIQCPNGDLLAFVEARHGVSDHNEKDVLMRRSNDRGLTWGPYEQIWGQLDEDDAGWKDPAPVVDEATGRLFYFMNTNESEKRLFYLTSDDSGHTWSDPIRIPDSLRRDEWKRWRNCPGPGIQLRRGQYKDRLLIPGHIVTKEDRHQAVVWYSDDHGANWQVSDPAVMGSDEISIVELEDGRVLMNIRSHGELDPGLDPRYRNFMYSDNGGESWYGLETKQDLLWDSGHGTITKLLTGKTSRLLAFHPLYVKRRDLTCFVSNDGGKSWPYSKLIHEAGGYSSVIVMDNHRIALSHNHGHKGRDGIDFVSFNLNWLTNGREAVDEPQRTLSHSGREQDSRPVIWREEFDLVDGTTRDEGDSAWTFLEGDNASGRRSGVNKEKFRAVASDAISVWKSEKIGIDEVSWIRICADFIKIGNFTSEDSLRIYYQLDDHPVALIESLEFSSLPQEDFETYQVRLPELDVSRAGQLQISIEAKVTRTESERDLNKVLYWDRVRVDAVR